MKIKDAIFIDPSNSQTQGKVKEVSDYYLLIKNNLTLLEKYPIQYRKVPT